MELFFWMQRVLHIYVENSFSFVAVKLIFKLCVMETKINNMTKEFNMIDINDNEFSLKTIFRIFISFKCKNVYIYIIDFFKLYKVIFWIWLLLMYF